MPITVRGVISYTLTDEELAIGRDLRRSFGIIDWGFTNYNMISALDQKMRKAVGIPQDSTPITNYQEIFYE